MDFFEDFDDDFDEGEFMEDDLFEDSFEEDLEMDDPIAGDTELDNEPTEDESQNNGFSTKDAFTLGGVMGWAYEEGRRERKHRKRKMLSDDSD